MKARSTFKILFYVKRYKLNKYGKTPVFARITVNRKRAELSIGHSVKPDLWDPESGYSKGTSKEDKQLNNYIDVVKYRIHQLMKEFREDNKEFTADNLKNAFLGKDDDSKYIIQIYQDHNDKFNELVGIEYSPETYQRYKTSLMHTQNFIKWYYKLDDLPVNRIDHEFIAEYEHYFKTKRNCSHNTAMKYIKNFKKIIRIAIANNWIKNDPFANYKMRLKKVDREYLNDEELETIMTKDLHFDRLNQVRDCFVFSCFSGLAYSDLKSLTPDHIQTGIDGKKWIMTKRKKTQNASNIPLLPIAENIIDKYKNHPWCIEKGVLLPVLSNQKMNAYLKEIADICGINKNLSSHTARHTFATTVTLNNNVPIESVSKMLGHSSISMTKIYARLLDKKVSHDMGHLYERYG